MAQTPHQLGTFHAHKAAKGVPGGLSFAQHQFIGCLVHEGLRVLHLTHLVDVVVCEDKDESIRTEHVRNDIRGTWRL